MDAAPSPAQSTAVAPMGHVGPVGGHHSALNPLGESTRERTWRAEAEEHSQESLWSLVLMGKKGTA